jgi:hypothetical protein
VLLEADRDADGRRARGAAGVAAAAAYGWDAVAPRYADRLGAIAASAPRSARPDVAPFPLESGAAARLLATPAWRGADRLAELVSAWASATEPGDDACLYLLGDRRAHGDGAELAGRVLEAAAAAGADLDSGADITIVVQPYQPGLEASVHAAVHGFVRLHGGDAGGVRLAAAEGNPVLEPAHGSIATWLDARRRLAA